MAMTPKEQLDILSAYVAGEKIQYKPIGCSWSKDNICGANYEFNFQRFEYRRLPKPLELWVNVYPEPRTSAKRAVYESKDDAIRFLGANGRTVHMIEVQDE